ncbi:uncharacterized protein JCM10292_003561 [Rhodotorula paludigena]|uniref:uncharacterized protein n=1 Tax=Rhodotorula paludigena TaxID=86838 RepID=UPI0031723C33
MGLLSTPNHQALIRDCYPPHSSSSSQGPLPQPVSNALSKLTFYAVNRPAKIPKVVAALVERATKARAGSSTHKSRQDLAVTVEILRALVVECGESGKDGAGELIKGAIAEDALRVAEMALGGEGAKDGLVATTAQIKREKRDPEMEARGASLFLAFATFLTPPFVGVADGVGRHYLRCLSLLSGLAQLQEPGQVPSRYVALKALDGAARSEFLLATGSDFDAQAGELVPALLHNCIATDLSELRKELSSALSSDDALSPLSPTLSSRKASAITVPDDSKETSRTPSIALTTLLLLSRLTTIPQVLGLQGAFSSFLSQNSSGLFWRASSQPVVLFFVRAFLAAAPPQHRAPMISWWSDRVGEIFERDTQHRSVTLLYLLKHLLDPSPQEEADGTRVAVEGVSAGGILNTLAELLIRRATTPSSSPSVSRPSSSHHLALASPSAADASLTSESTDSDPLLRPILSTLGALARSSALRGYPTQLEDLVSDLVDLLRSLKHEEGRAQRLVSGMSAAEKSRAKVRLVKALGTLLHEAPGSVRAQLASRVESAANGDLRDEPADGMRRDEETLLPPRSSLGEEADSASTIKASPAAALSGTGKLVLGKPVNGERDLFSPEAVDETVRAKKAFAASQLLDPSADGEQPVVRVSTPGGATASPSPDSQLRSPAPSRQPVSPRAFSRSLFLLTEPDAYLRLEYAGVVALYLSKEIPLVQSTGSGADQLSSFYRQLHGSMFGLAVGELASSASPSARSPGAESTSDDTTSHALHRTRSLRSQKSRRSFLDEPESPSPTTSAAPSPADYAALVALVEAVQARPAPPAAMLEGVPALLALDAKAAPRWEVGLAGAGDLGATRDGGADPARAQACREVAVRGLLAVAKAWSLRELAELMQEALKALSPSVLPAEATPLSQFAVSTTAAPSALNASLIVDILASDAALQKATQLDRTSLSSLLSQAWSYETVKAEAASSRSPYLSGALPSRSLFNLSPSRGGSTLRLSSAPGSPPSFHLGSQALHGTSNGGGGSLSPSVRSRFRSGTTITAGSSSFAISALQTPSLADLQAGFVSGGHASARSSAAASVASSAGTAGGQGRRRTSRATPESVLERIGRRAKGSAGGVKAVLAPAQV